MIGLGAAGTNGANGQPGTGGNGGAGGSGGDALGGGVYNETGASLTLINALFFDNTASGGAGGTGGAGAIGAGGAGGADTGHGAGSAGLGHRRRGGCRGSRRRRQRRRLVQSRPRDPLRCCERVPVQSSASVAPAAAAAQVTTVPGSWEETAPGAMPGEPAVRPWAVPAGDGGRGGDGIGGGIFNGSGGSISGPSILVFGNTAAGNLGGAGGVGGFGNAGAGGTGGPNQGGTGGIGGAGIGGTAASVGLAAWAWAAACSIQPERTCTLKAQKNATNPGHERVHLESGRRRRRRCRRHARAAASAATAATEAVLANGRPGRARRRRIGWRRRCGERGCRRRIVQRRSRDVHRRHREFHEEPGPRRLSAAMAGMAGTYQGRQWRQRCHRWQGRHRPWAATAATAARAESARAAASSSTSRARSTINPRLGAKKGSKQAKATDQITGNQAFDSGAGTARPREQRRHRPGWERPTARTEPSWWARTVRSITFTVGVGGGIATFGNTTIDNANITGNHADTNDNDVDGTIKS